MAPRPASFVSMTRAQVAAAIGDRAAAYVAQGDEWEIAIIKAGKEFRADRQRQAAAAIAYLEHKLNAGRQ